MKNYVYDIEAMPKSMYGDKLTSIELFFVDTKTEQSVRFDVLLGTPESVKVIEFKNSHNSLAHWILGSLKVEIADTVYGLTVPSYMGKSIFTESKSWPEFMAATHLPSECYFSLRKVLTLVQPDKAKELDCAMHKEMLLARDNAFQSSFFRSMWPGRTINIPSTVATPIKTSDKKDDILFRFYIEKMKLEQQ